MYTTIRTANVHNRLVNLYNRNIFKTFLYIYIFQDDKCRLMRNLSLSKERTKALMWYYSPTKNKLIYQVNANAYDFRLSGQNEKYNSNIFLFHPLDPFLSKMMRCPWILCFDLLPLEYIDLTHDISSFYYLEDVNAEELLDIIEEVKFHVFVLLIWESSSAWKLFFPSIFRQC